MEISFYHLTSSPLKKALPALLEKAFEGGLRALVIADKPAIKQLDDDMWTFHPRKFLPHGTDRRELMPVFLSDEISNDNDNLRREVLAITLSLIHI
jgi:DNA polymerase-3 subunit chi